MIEFLNTLHIHIMLNMVWIGPLIMLISVLYLFRGGLYDAVYLLTMLGRVLTLSKDKDTTQYPENEVLAWIALKIEQVIGKRYESSHLISFYLLSISCGVLVWIATFGKSTVFISVGAGLVSMLLPLLVLVVRARRIEVEASYEALSVLTELSTQYRLSNKNLVLALDNTVLALMRRGEAKYTSRYLIILSMKLKQYQTASELDQILRNFALSLNTEWARLLSGNFRVAARDYVNITAGLEDIKKDLDEAKRRLEEVKRSSMEAAGMIKFFVPISYVGSFFAVSYLGTPLKEFVHRQFSTPTGIFSFVGILVCYGMAILLLTFFRKSKFDLGV